MSIIDDHARAWIATSPQRPRGAAGHRGDRSIDRSVDRDDVWAARTRRSRSRDASRDDAIDCV